MANKDTIPALDVTLINITERFVFAVDLNKILPAIRGGGKNDELNYCIIKSRNFWTNLVKLGLPENATLKK